ncbi:MAG: hypothetical protein FD155_830 [Bacteroidetes bacterium]|nr:MAG: hypothetical protein FD155_830 [Bacteroidota bacterium]
MPEALIKFIQNKLYFSLFLLVLIYLVGIFSVLFGDADKLMLLTPFNLLFASGLILYNAQGINKRYLLWFALIAIMGFLIELAGIETGIIFGEYAYGHGLGIRLFNVPLMIGINWAVLVFGSAAVFNSLSMSLFGKSTLGASLMVSYDFLLEPVAMRFDFWDWSANSVPFQNYLAWWIVAFVMLIFIHKNVKDLRNKIAIYVIGVQTLFFIILVFSQNLSLF